MGGALSRVSMRRLLLALLLTLAACDAADPCPTGACTSGDEVVNGVNLTALFAAPIESELGVVRNRWLARTAAVAGSSGPRLVALDTLLASDGAEVVVVAGVTPSVADTLFVAAIRRPIRPPGDVAGRPVVLVLPDAPGTLRADDLHTQTGLVPSRINDVVTVGIAGRGAAVLVGGRSFSAPSDAIPYVTDVEDAQVVAARIRELEPLARPDRMAAVGVGRGGTAALLLRARGGVTPTSDLDLAVAIVAPSTWFAPSVRADFRDRLLGRSAEALPDADDVFARTAGAIAEGSVDPGEARLRLLERSPAPWLVAPFSSPVRIHVLAIYRSLDDRIWGDQGGALQAGLDVTGAVLTFEDLPEQAIQNHTSASLTITRELEARLAL